MPIKTLTASYVIQVCAACGAENKISFDRGGLKTKTGPFALTVGQTLELQIDGGPATTVTFSRGDFPDFAAVSAAQLAAKLAKALFGVLASDDSGGCLVESASTGDKSRVEVTGGSARAALGLLTDGPRDPCPARPQLGTSAGGTKDPNVIALRRCACGATECLVRTFDAAPAALAGTPFSEHRKAVNAMAEQFKARGWLHPDLASSYAAETKSPVDIERDFIATPLTIPVPPAPADSDQTR